MPKGMIRKNSKKKMNFRPKPARQELQHFPIHLRHLLILLRRSQRLENLLTNRRLQSYRVKKEITKMTIIKVQVSNTESRTIIFSINESTGFESSFVLSYK
ncbi:hypothetical protein KQX54_009544 [Cotesia glomerata]|uniref:Uncharacterized protein n=1 Tax=Cotesia glomerata TaxID=32391 RepID=A0AAV7ISS1_COTGL|nr:hypothetical protein KQX54_009544 [Cotesia glomerata]